MAKTSSSQNVPMRRQYRQTSTSTDLSTNLSQCHSTPAPPPHTTSAADQGANLGDNTPVTQSSLSPNDVAATPHGQGMVKRSGCSAWWYGPKGIASIAILSALLTLVLFLPQYLKKPDRELISIENEYDFCGTHPVC